MPPIHWFLTGMLFGMVAAMPVGYLLGRAVSVTFAAGSSACRDGACQREMTG